MKQTIVDQEAEIKRITYTIVLTKLLPRREVMHVRHFADGKKLNTERILSLLRQAGHDISVRDEPTLMIANEYKGIKITSSNGGLMVCPKNPEDYDNLRMLLIEDGYYYHPCYFVDKKK